MQYLGEVVRAIDPDPINVGWWIVWIVDPLSIILVHQECDVLLVVPEVLNVGDVPREKKPNSSSIGSSSHLQSHLRILSNVDHVLGWPSACRPHLMKATSVREHSRVPIQVEYVKVMLQGLVIDPKHS